MKKIIIAFIFFFAGLGFTYAQKTPVKTKAKTTTSADKMVDKTKNKGMKSDGTPDMRLKENKEKAKTKTVTGPVKKDGSADMRFKSNKKTK